VDVIGLSIMSGAHLPICRRLRELMMAEGIEDVPVVVGGVIPKQDIPKLRQMGVNGFPRGLRSIRWSPRFAAPPKHPVTGSCRRCQPVQAVSSTGGPVVNLTFKRWVMNHGVAKYIKDEKDAVGK